MKLVLLSILVSLVAAMALVASPAHAQVELTLVEPPDAARLDAPPEEVRLCFSQPVVFEDNTAFSFVMRRPDGTGLGHRDRFQPDGKCLDIFVNVADDYAAGAYTLEWSVTAAEGGDEGSGTILYRVVQGGTPAPGPSPTPVETVPPGTPVKLTEVDPPDGAQLDAPPEVVHICFSQPVNVTDVDSFDFNYKLPDGGAMGRRTAFLPDGTCADVFPGLPDERPEGEYTIEWRVTALEGGGVGSGTIRFDVTQSSSAAPGAEITPTPAATPVAGDLDDDGPDILLVALITIGSVSVAAALATIGYFVRRRIGYEPHRPPEGDEGDEGH